MKFHHKERQDVLEVLSYQDGVCVYGFCQNNEDFLAVKMDDQETTEEWLIVPLTKKDKPSYEQMKENILSLGDFMQGKSGLLTTFDLEGRQVSETVIPLIPKSLVKAYEISA